MKGKLSIFARKTFALVIAISMSFPTGVIAAGEETKTYDKATSIMGLNEKTNEEVHQTGQIDNTDKLETDAYIMQARASLADDLEKISYQLTISNKHKDTSDKDLSLKFTPNPNSNITDIRVKSAKAKIENKLADIDIKERSNKGEISSLIVDTKAYDEIIMEVEANVRKAKDARTYETLISLDDGENKADLNYRLITNKETIKEDDQDKEIISLDLNKEESQNLRGEFKSGEFLSFLQSADTIVWTDYLVNSKRESEKMTYDLKLDDKQDTKNTKITLDYFENTKEGFILKKEFSQAIDYSNKIEFEIPAGYIAKLALTTRVDKKNTKTKSYSLNNRQVKNPIYIEGNKETSNEDDEEGGEDNSDDHTHKEAKVTTKNEDDKKKQVEKKEENKTQTQITAKDSSGNDIQVIEKDKKDEKKISALALNKDSLITRLSGQGKLTQELETAIEKLASDLDLYNDGKITDRELKDYTKALAEKYNIEKTDLRIYLESILSGVNKEKNKAANLNYDEIITYAYPENKKETKTESVDKETKQKAPVENKLENKKVEPKNDAKEETKETPKQVPTDNKTSKSSKETTDKDQALKAYKKDLAKLKEAAKKEEKKGGLIEGIKGLFGQSDLAKADKELKAALADDKNGIEEIQNLLNSFEKKYKLSRADQARLMENNNAAIEALVEKDRNNNFRPHIFAGTDSNGLNLEGKKFHILTRFDTSNIGGPIQSYQYFKIHLDEKLTVKDPSKLEPIMDKGSVVALPSYDSVENIITYQIQGPISKNIQVPIDIPVDYNTDKITLGPDGTFTVVNKVSGMGITNPPKDLVPQKVDKNGNLAGSIIEPDRHDVNQIIEQGANYKVNLDATVKPVVKNKKIEGYNWSFRITSDTDLQSLGYKANFTTVKGSGLGEIKDVRINGEKAELKDQLNNHEFGIVSSKHHDLKKPLKEITYDFYTGATEKQSSYMLDFSLVLKNQNKVGAKRFLVKQAYTDDDIAEATPNRVGMNNRTTILGEFKTEEKAQWTITDGVSTGDVNEGLPLETRKLSGNQNISSAKRAVYGLNENGEMVVKYEVRAQDKNVIPQKEKLVKSQLVGTIAVYQYETDLTKESTEGYSLSGVNINKYHPLTIKQTWAGIDSTKNMPAQKILVQDSEGNKISEDQEVTQGETGKADREIFIPAVKKWKISTKQNPGGGLDTVKEKITPNLVQKLPDPQQIGYTYKEKYNYYMIDDDSYHIYNVMSESTNTEDANFTIIKTDSKDPNKKLEGAEFTLQSPRETIKLKTGADGQINFKNVSPGTYYLVENKAPNGYKLDQEPKQITVHNDGTVSVSGNNISMQGGKVATVLARHNYYPSYPSYMNAMQYGNIDEKGNVEFYIYLKPEANSYSGSTDKDTRLNLNLTGGGKIESVEVLDVAPGSRYDTRNKMQDQTAGTYKGNEVLNKDHANKIIGQDNVTDGYTGKTGYQIKFPSSRFDGDWGFLVKVKATGGTSTSTVSYDWLTDNPSVANEAKIQETIGLSTKNSSDSAGAGAADDATRITITNEEFKKSPVELTKLDENKVDGLSGATFTLKDSAGNPIIDVQSQAEGEGKTKGLVSFGEQAPGTYTIEEKKAPKGYKNSNVVFDVNVSEDGKVTYKARFKDGDGTPINGLDYILEDVEAGQDATDYDVTVVSQNMKLQEKQSQPDDGRIGWQEGIWEAYGIESYRYNGTYTIGNVVKGGRFKIQFDRNLDFKRYVYEIPDLKDGEGNLLAKPYFNYDTNLLTYVFVKDASNVSASLEIIGIIPDKYYATQTNKTSGYDFKIVVDPDNPKADNTLNFNVKTDYYTYDSQGGGGPLTSEYITDIYKGDDGEIYMKAVSYYNPTNLSSGPRTVRLDWLSMRKPRPGLEYYRADGYPAFGFDDLKVYKVFGDQNRKQNLMPLSYGIRPEKDTFDYIRVYSKSNVNPDQGFSESGGDVRVTYNPAYLKSTEGLLDYGHNKHPLEIDLPRVSGNEGYVIVQTFKVTDEQRFKDLWSGYYLSNGSRHTGSYQKGNYNWAKGSETGQEIPKFYSQRIKLINRKYQPGSFKIKKTNEADNTALPGAIFELKDQEGKTINRYSGSDGIVEFNDLEPGAYTLQEAQAPDGFIKSNRRWQVVVYDTGNVVINEVGGSGTSFTGKDIILIPVSNKPSGGDFKVYKKDSTGKALPGAKFKITKHKDTSFTPKEVTSNENGVVEFKNLTDGTYIIEESEAPDGYKKLDKKWVLVIDADGKKKVYNYREKSDQKIGSILEQENVNWVNVAGRSLDGWNLYDNRRADWTGNYPTPFKLGTRIVGINTKDKYVIQRYVINPEAEKIGKTTATIHREKVEYTNMDWYNGNAVAGVDYQVFKLDKAVTGPIADIRLADYKAENITSFVEGSAKQVEGRYGEPDRLSLDFPATDKPIVVDIKVPYKDVTGGVGTGMDWVENGTTYWKSDYYERVNIIKESGPVIQGEEGGIQGSYIGEGSLDVRNEQKSFGFKLEKVKEGDPATVVPGAEFKLTGPDKGDGSKQEERFMTTGPDGMISFTKLKPGTYTLEENKAAPGYEKSNTTWTVRIDPEGKVYIKTNPQDQAIALANASLSVVDTAEPLNKSPRLYSTYTNPLVRDVISPVVTKSVDTNNISTTERIERINAESLTDELVAKATGTGGDLASIRGLLVETTKRPAIVKMAQESQGESMGLEIGDSLVGNPLGAGDGWERVDPNRSTIASNQKHKITINPSTGGSVTAPKYGETGNNINLKILPDAGYEWTGNTITDKDGKVIAQDVFSFTMPDKDVIVTNTFEKMKNDVTIFFSAGDGGSGTMKSQTVPQGSYKLPKPTFPAQAGKEFKAWEVSGKEYQPGDTIQVSANTTVAAVWKDKAISQGYSINIDPSIKNGSVISNVSRAKENDVVTFTVTPAVGYELASLTINNTNQTAAGKKGTFTMGMPNYDVNVTATFRRNPYKSIISFDPNGGSGVMKNQEVYNGYQYRIPNCEFTPPPGKEFLNWTINGYTYTPGTVVTINQDYTLKAQWKDAPVNLVGIEVNSENHKTTYKVGEELDVTNLTIEATMSNGTKHTIPVYPYMVKGFSSASEAKDMPLKISFGGKTTTYKIDVVKPEPDAFDINIISSTKGKLEADKLTAKEGDTVTLSVIANEGYEFNSYKVTDADGKDITITDGKFTMPKSAVNVSASFIREGEITPSDEEEIKIPENGFARITNNQTGIELKIFKKNTSDIGLIGAEFELKKDDGTDKIIATAVSDDQGNVKFVDKDGEPIKLQVGKYLLTETKSPAGYKKPAAPWKLEVVEENGQLVIKESGPKHTSTSYLSSEGAMAGDNTKSTDTIKYKSIIKNIDPVNKTFVQRIYVDTRGYNGKVNVQITPTTKREEIDIPSTPPTTTKGGVKTAYRTTYKISNPGTDPDVDDILNSYDLRKSNVSVVNTARWRPFDWGFDEDQINLENDGVYFIDIEGFYDDNIVDLKEIELKVDFYAGEWVFAQRTYENGQLGWKYDKDIGDTDGLQTKRDAAYQQGMEALYAYYSKLYGEAAAKTWFYGNSDNKKYDVWLRKGATISGRYYDAGRIVLRSDLENSDIKNARPIQTSYTKADIKDLYSSDNIKTVPQDGMTITNEDETYNITFSKHAKLKTDGSEEDYNANRLEGAVFKLQKKEGSFWYDVDESYVASAFNGYFGFRRLEPGRYRLLEVTPPIGYKPIDGELLQFTIKQMDTRSGKVINPKTKTEVELTELIIIDPNDEEKIELNKAKAKIKDDPDNKVYNFSELVETNEFNMDTCLILSEVKDKDGNPKEIPLKTANFIDPESNEPMGRIIAGAQGYITLEYKEGGYVAEYGKAGSSGGSLVDYVTAATAKNMGKILNEKPGKGKVTIKKFDENGYALGSVEKDGLKVGAKFQAIRISGKKDKDGNPVKDAVYEGTVDANGELVIDGLPVGDYELKEVANPSGHINTGQVWHFTVGGKGLDPYSGDIARTGQDLTDKITLSKSELKVVRPNAEDEKATGHEGNGVIRPHVGQTLEFDNEFKLDSNIEINPGDYFVLKLSDNIDLEGVKTDGVGNLDLFADGVGTIAKAEYDKAAGTITYTFTRYAEQYKLFSIENRLGAHISLKNQRNSDPYAQVGLSVGDSKVNHNINIKYIVDTISKYDDNATVNLASKITEYNTNTGEFVHYFYVNRDRYYNAKNQYFQYKPNLNIEDLQLTYYKLKNNNDPYINRSMPESFAVDESDSNLLRSGGTSPEYVKANVTKTYNLGNIGPYGSMIVKVTGRMKPKEGQKILSYKGISALYSTYQYDAYDNYNRYLGTRTAMSPYVDRWDAIYEFENINTASAELSISAVNPANRIKFKKVDPQGRLIKDKDGNVLTASFSLFKNGGTAEKPNETWTPKGNAKTIDTNGIVLYEKLEEGYYKVVETTAPTGYIKPTEAVAYFKVDSSGKIYHKVTVTKPNSDETEEIFRQVEGTIPINIVNNKPIEFEKVDGDDNSKKLSGAVFKVLYKESKDGDYTPLKVTKGKEEVEMTVTSGENGKFKLDITKDGYYALEETKAPDGYTMFPGYIKEFKLEKGRVLVREKDPLKASLTKGENGMLTSQILEVNKDKGTFKQRLVINPNNNKWTFDEYDSHLRLYVDGWNVEETNTSKLIKVAVLDKGKSISDLKDTDFKPVSPTNYNVTSTTNPLKYSIKDMYSGGENTDYTRPNPNGSNLVTEKALVVEFTGKLNGNATDPVNPKSDVYINAFSEMVDEVTNKLDITKVSESDGSYIDTTIPIPVENRKAEYPLTGGPKAWIGFTILGLFFMTLAGFYYNKKKIIG